jgi:hypothetical protein
MEDDDEGGCMMVGRGQGGKCLFDIYDKGFHIFHPKPTGSLLEKLSDGV